MTAVALDRDVRDDELDVEASGSKWTAHDPATVPKDYGLGKYWS